ncbi:MAG: hypothetical protein HC833_19305 [Leptolyngbyaceae cyanobacterium RM1_406_9]|nr:hypothetical protein [Leptolyngbyaceae cyanobacterium RM1_406_9]
MLVFVAFGRAEYDEAIALKSPQLTKWGRSRQTLSWKYFILRFFHEPIS